MTDQMGRWVPAPPLPQRIVSLVPSQTELLFDLGLADRVVGVTKFCLHPAGARMSAAIVGGTKNFDYERIAALRPDLIIGNKEENDQAGIEKLAADFPVWLSDINNLPEALDMIRQIGFITGTVPKSAEIAREITASFAGLSAPAQLISTAYFIWRKPYMVAASSTFINDLLERAGFSNVFAGLGRYPEITAQQLAAAAPQRILLSSEPYPFGPKHLAEFRQICPASQLNIVDGELFSWYGSRLRLSADYLRRLRAADGETQLL